MKHDKNKKSGYGNRTRAEIVALRNLIRNTERQTKKNGSKVGEIPDSLYLIGMN